LIRLPTWKRFATTAEAAVTSDVIATNRAQGVPHLITLERTARVRQPVVDGAPPPIPTTVRTQILVVVTLIVVLPMVSTTILLSPVVVAIPLPKGIETLLHKGIETPLPNDIGIAVRLSVGTVLLIVVLMVDLLLAAFITETLPEVVMLRCTGLVVVVLSVDSLIGLCHSETLLGQHHEHRPRMIVATQMRRATPLMDSGITHRLAINITAVVSHHPTWACPMRIKPTIKHAMCANNLGISPSSAHPKGLAKPINNLLPSCHL